MAEMAVSFVVEQLLTLLTKETNLIRGVHKEFSDIKDELGSIQAFLKDADKKVASHEGDNNSERLKIWVKQVRGIAFHIEDVIDEYMLYVAHQPHDYGCSTLFHKISHFIKTLTPRYQIMSEIQDIKSDLSGIRERCERYGFKCSLEQGSSSSKGNQNAKWHDPRVAALYIDETEVVGFQMPRDKLVIWMVKGRIERSVISVVGMGGQGKTTLAKKVFDSKEVIEFDCRLWINVSQSYNVEDLLRDMLLNLYKQKQDEPPKDIFQMDRSSLTEEVRNYLQQKRYVIAFDDVWSVHFWDDFEFATIDNKNGSKILITTRNIDVAMSCKKFSFIEVHKMQPLTEQQSLKLFNKKVFRFDYEGCCPKELVDISSTIVKKCKGLPLAIVAIGGLLSTKEKNVFEWKKFSENLSLELKMDSHLIGIKEILGFSFNDLPYYLKSCLLYFGMYPEDYKVKSKILIRQWIAEGFVMEETKKTFEEVAIEYLNELIHRNLVQVYLTRIDGTTKTCFVHDLIREMILEKCEDSDFSKYVNENSQSSSSEIVRRLSIATTSNNLMARIESSHVRSLLFFTSRESNVDFMRRIPRNYRLMKVLGFEDALFNYVPKNLGSLINLKYLSFRNLHLKGNELLKSIRMLKNLETLDLKGAPGKELYVTPYIISKLRKLRHFHGNMVFLTHLKDDRGMISLQTLNRVFVNIDEIEELMRELKKLKHLTKLSIGIFGDENISTLPTTVVTIVIEMQHLEKLTIASGSLNVFDFIDLKFVYSQMLRNLVLIAKLEKLPKWIAELQNLVQLKLENSELIDDPIKSLKNMQSLLSLSLRSNAYVGESLHFQDGWFPNLKKLCLKDLNNLNSIIIDKGALPSLKTLELWKIPQLKRVPNGMQHLMKLHALCVFVMPAEFVQNIAPNQGEGHWIIKHVPLVLTV